MGFYLDLYTRTASLQKKEFDEIMSLNEKTKQHNIVLTEEKVRYIMDSRKSALSDTGRIEFGENTAKKIVAKFCESPYVNKYNIHTVTEKLLEIFYYAKNETEDLIKDDALLDYMYKAFNGECKGSATLLYDWAVTKLIHDVRLSEVKYGKQN